MKVKHKLVSGFIVVTSFIWLVGISAIIASKINLENTIQQYSTASLSRISRYVDNEINSKIEYFLGRTKGAMLQQVLSESNEKVSKIINLQKYIETKETAWLKAQKDSITPFMKSLLTSKLTRSFQEEIKVFEKEYGQKLITEILLTDSSGTLVAQTGKATDYYQADETWWIKAKEKGIYLTEFTFDESSGQHAMEVCIRIGNNEGNFIGIIKAVFSLENLLNSIRIYLTNDSKLISENINYIIFDNSGKTFFSSQNYKFLEQYPHAEEIKSLIKQDKYFSSYIGVNGDKKLSFFKSMPGQKNFKGFGWTIVAEHDEDQLFAGVYSLRNIIIVNCIVITILGVLVSLFLSNRILNPLKNIFHATKRIGEGNYSYKLKISTSDEIAELAKSFNEMSDKINDSNLKILIHNDEIQQINRNLEQEISGREKAQADLWEEKEKLSVTLKAITDAVIATDHAGKITIMNRTAEILTGYAFHETIEMHINDVFKIEEQPERKFKDVLQLINKTSSGSQYLEEVTLINNSGKSCFISNSISSILKDNGEINGIVLIFRDITEKNKIQKQLIESEKRLRNLFDNSLLGIFRSTLDGEFLEINPAFAKMFKYENPEEVINSISNISDQIYFDPNDRNNIITELINGTGSGIFETKFRTKDGEIITGNLSISIEKDKEGNLLYLEGFLEDITDRKIAEENFFKIFNSNPEWIAISSFEDGSHLNINQAYCELFGYSRYQVIGKTSKELNVWVDYEQRQRIINVVYNEGIVHNEEIKLRVKGGSIITCLVSFEKILYSGSECIMAIGRDITERKIAEENFYKIFNSNPEWIAISTMKEGRHLNINKAYCDFFYYQPNEILNKTSFELNLIKNYQTRESIVESLTQGKTLHNIELQLNKKNGEEAICLVSFEKILYSGEPCVMSIGRDITERKIAEENFQKIFNSNPEWIAITTMNDGRHLAVNQSYCDLFQHSYKNVIGKTGQELNLIIDDIVSDKIKNIVEEDGVLRNIEVKLRKSNGEIIIGLASYEKITYNGVNCLMSIGRDITERKTWEESIAAEKERLSVTLRSIGDGVITTDVNGKIIMLNRIAEKLTGWTNDEAKDRHIEEVFNIINLHTRKKCESPFYKVLHSDIIVELESDTILISKDGTERLIADSGSPIRDIKSQIIGIVIVFRDVTQKRKSEDELQKIQKIESIGVLAGGLAHDFNNILTSIAGSISLALLKEKNDEKNTYLKLAENAAMRAKGLTYQLLTFSKGGDPVKKLISMEDLVKNCAAFSGSGSNTEILFDIQEKLWQAEVDEGQISQVINNMIINATQAMPNGGKITIKLANHELKTGNEFMPPGKFIAIKISDTGIGIGNDIINKIFDPYFTTKEKGSGLGLAISYSIIKKHNGFVEVQSQPGSGSEFSIYLPASKEAAPSTIKKNEPVIDKGIGNILVMDDEESIRFIMKDILKMLGYSVTTVVDGTEAISKYEEARKSNSPFDVVIMDLTIPGGMGGRETVEKLLKLDPSVKAIVSSGYSNDPVMSDFKKYGFMGSIAKPYRIVEVSKVIKSLIIPGDN